MSEEYNGWTNYATWRVSLEIFEDDEYFKGYDAEALKDYAEQIIEDECSNGCMGIAGSYALTFLSDVNWYEIEEHLK